MVMCMSDKKTATFSLNSKTRKILNSNYDLKKSRMVEIAVGKVFGKPAKVKRLGDY